MGYWLDQICDQERKTEINNATTYQKACNFSCKKRSGDEAKPYKPGVSYQRKQYLDEMTQM